MPFIRPSFAKVQKNILQLTFPPKHMTKIFQLLISSSLDVPYRYHLKGFWDLRYFPKTHKKYI